MSLKFNCSIELMRTVTDMDESGFMQQRDEPLCHVKAYREDRHGGETWKNRALFTTANTLFRVRAIPGMILDTRCTVITEEGRFNILSVEDIKRRGLYWEILTERVMTEGVVSRGKSGD